MAELHQFPQQVAIGFSRLITLSVREREVLSLVSEGFSSSDAGDVLSISKRTVDFHIASILTKLKVNNRLKAVRIAFDLGFLPYDPAETISQQYVEY